MRRVALALSFAVAACAPRHGGTGTADDGFLPSEGKERVTSIALDSGVKATIVAPAQLDASRPVDLILYALPNGNTTAETMGKKLGDGIGWRYGIQHIGAQTRALRTLGLAQAVVVYLEADTKSWPEWRRRMGYDSANVRIVKMVDQLRATVGAPGHVSVTLTGHSGGGSFMFGFIEGQRALPPWLDRIAFLDANYNFDARHVAKLTDWLHADSRNTLVVLTYDDREIMLDGKKVVSDSGGTWRASQRMLASFTAPFALAAGRQGDFLRYHGAQVEILLHPNPGNRILHTEMIGEMNGYMHALLVHRAAYDARASLLVPIRAYDAWIEH